MRVTLMSVTFLSVMLVSKMPAARSDNILLMDSLIGKSHYQMLSIIGAELVRKGHNVTMLVGQCTPSMRYIAKQQDIFTFETYDCGITAEDIEDSMEAFSRITLSGEMSSFGWYAKLWMGWLEDSRVRKCMDFLRTCTTTFLGNSQLFDKLKEREYDLVICDLTSPMCSIAAHDLIRVPYINLANGGPLGTRYMRWMGVPSPLSYVPEYLTHFTDQMSFPQRAKNFLMHLVSLVVFDFGLPRSLETYRAELGLPTGDSVREILGKSSLFILNWDVVLEYPRPCQANVILAGGISTRPAQPLSGDFEKFVQGSGDDGVLIFSVSTLVNYMDPAMADMIASALARLPMRVVWKFKGDRTPDTLGNNTMLAGWLPQSDLLGHNKSKVFVFHGGINGAYEALYYGVPVVGIPLFADQTDDLLRLRSLGMGEYVHDGIHGVTSESLYQMIMKVASTPSYRESAKAASARYRANPQHPVELATFWIDHVLRNGADHLRPRACELTWVQRTSLDTMLVLGVLTSPVIVAVLWACFRLFRKSMGCLKARLCSHGKSKSD